MYNLSNIGRQWICRKLGMLYDSNSIFVKDEKAFNDRMDLLNPVYNIDKLVELYKNELNNFSLEIEYNDYLKESLIKLATDIKNKINIANSIIELLSRIKDKTCLNYFKKEKTFENALDSKAYLRIYFDYPMYEGFRYLCNGFSNVKSNAYDYIYSITNSKFLAYDSDISIVDNIDEYVSDAMLFISASLFSLLSPKLLNSKELKYIGKSEIIYISSYNKSVTQLNNIVELIRTNEILSFENANIELYNINQLATNNTINEKVSLIHESTSIRHKIIDCDEVTFLAYLRKQKGEHRSKYDNYFNYKGNLAKLQSNIKIDWIK